MTDVTATISLESPDLALTETVAYDESAVVQPVSGSGTVPDSEAHLYTVRSADFDRFEAGLAQDHTVAAFERVVDIGTGYVYRFEYTAEASVFSAAVASVDGVSLDWTNDGTAWTVQVWLPDRDALGTLWEHAERHDIEFTLQRVSDYAAVGTDAGLTAAQRDALLLALELGYFEEPRAASLRDVAAELDISQPAAGGLLRRGIRRLLLSTIAADEQT